MEVAILIFDRLTALDAIGPYEVLRSAPGTTVRFVGKERGPKRTDAGSLALMADYELAEIIKPEIVVIPGGPGQVALMDDREVLDWVRQVHTTSRWTTSVCTGSLVLAAAGLLEGLPATTHWLAMEMLKQLGAQATAERVVIQGRIVTAAGVSAGIDMALTLVAREFGDDMAKAIQLGIEYDPQPPFDSGSPQKAPAHIVSRLRERSRFIMTGTEPES